MRLLLGVLVLLAALYVCGAGYSSRGARKSFEQAFDDQCGKYPFVDSYLKKLDAAPHPDDKYVIFSFAEHGMGSNGGLGDRLAGLVTAAAFALRKGRRLLIAADAPFKSSFVPYHKTNRMRTAADNSLADARFHWKDWHWAGFMNAEGETNVTFNRGCVNPKGRNKACALDQEGGVDYDRFKVVKHRGNRCYLCRWALKSGQGQGQGQSGLGQELRETLGIRSTTDLYEVAGCLLRLAMWPSEELWARLDRYVEAQEPRLLSWLGQPAARGPTRQVSVHFRCGDSSFGSSNGALNPQCVADISKGVWKGTSFGDDYSLDSPVDLAACARRLAEAMAVDGGSVLIYVASDYAPSALQINATTNWPLSLAPVGACHVDHTSAAGAHECAVGLYVQWLLLAVSDSMVVQSLKKDRSPQYAYYNAYSEETAELEARYEAVEPGGPVSAFSRYAAIYGLRPDGLRYGLGCTPANRTALSWQTRGNWMCDNKNFY